MEFEHAEHEANYRALKAEKDPTTAPDRAWVHRATKQARQALSDFCRSAGNRCHACQARHMDRGETIHIFSIPVDFERDADFILGDVIDERDALRKAAQELLDRRDNDVDECTSVLVETSYLRQLRDALKDPKQA